MYPREAPEGLAAALTTSHDVFAVVDVWRGTDLLAAAVPLLDGALVENGDQQVPEQLTLQVPRHDPTTGTRWAPAGPTSPLAAAGQRARVSYVVARSDGSHLVTQLGWYLLTDWDADDQVVEVEAAGLLRVLDEAKLLAPTSPPVGATFKSELRRLVAGYLPISFDAALVDRAVPRAMAWQDDRLGAVYELADAWPALLYVDADGVLIVAPPPEADDDPALVLVEYGGTVVDARDSGTRDGLANVWVARGEDSTDAARPPVVAIARDDDPASPTYADGPYGQVVDFFASPLLRTTAQAFAAAQTRLRGSLLRARAVPLDVLPDPRVRPWVRVDYEREDGDTLRGRVVQTSLPLTPDGGAQRVDLGEVL